MVGIDDFLEFLLRERGASANTIIAYDHDLRQLADFLRERLGQQGEISWRTVNRATVRRFIKHLKAQGYEDSSVARKLAAVRRFFAFLAAKGMISGNPASGLSAPRLPKPPSGPPAPAEIERLVGEISRKGTPAAKRDLAMLELLWATGMQVSELVSLDVDSVGLGPAPAVRFSGAKPRSRTIPIRSRAADALREYMEGVRPVLAIDRGEVALFVNQRGGRLSRQGFWFNLKKYARAAGLSRPLAPKTLRYSYASHLLRTGMSLQEVQGMLGHASISTTRVYLSLIRDQQSRPAVRAR